MSPLKLILIGFGNVGQGLARILAESESRLDNRMVQIVAICDLHRGSLYDPNDLDIRQLLTKGPIALHYRELAETAQSKKLHLGIEGTVMSGTPSLALGLTHLRAAGGRFAMDAMSEPKTICFNL